MPAKSHETEAVDPPSPSHHENAHPNDSMRSDTHHSRPSKTNRCGRKGRRSFQLGMGIGVIFLVVGSTLLVALSLPGGFLPPSIGSLAVVLLALGTLGIGTSGNRSV